MINLTQQEKHTLLIIAIVFFLGSTIQIAFKRYPYLKNSVNLLESQHIYPKININQATMEQLIIIPYIGRYTARNIIQFREHNGPFNNLEELKQIKGIREKNYQHFSVYLKLN